MRAAEAQEAARPGLIDGPELHPGNALQSKAPATIFPSYLTEI
jgi:hypothetical protein